MCIQLCRKKGLRLIKVNIKYYSTFQTICNSTQFIPIFTCRTCAAFMLLLYCLFKNQSGKNAFSPTVTRKEVKEESDI